MIINFILGTSFLLEGIFSLCVPIFETYLFPLFTLVSLVCVYPFLRKHEHSYEKHLIVIGLCYDLIYTNTVFLYTIMFFLLSYIISFCYRFLSRNIWNQILIVTIVIVCYRSIMFLILAIIGYISFDINILFDSIISSFIVNILFSAILYLLLNLLKKKKFII